MGRSNLTIFSMSEAKTSKTQFFIVKFLPYTANTKYTKNLRNESFSVKLCYEVMLTYFRISASLQRNSSQPSDEATGSKQQ